MASTAEEQASPPALLAQAPDQQNYYTTQGLEPEGLEALEEQALAQAQAQTLVL
jgi:hypothetical protein